MQTKRQTSANSAGRVNDVRTGQSPAGTAKAGHGFAGPVITGPAKADKKLIGDLGEQFAAGVLFSEGWRILERKFRCPLGEIDIIAEGEDGCLCFIEVKTRMSSRMGLPAEAVDARKQRRIRRTAQWYLHDRRLDGRPVRFMVFALSGSEIDTSFS